MPNGIAVDRHRRAQPRPCEFGLTLALAPRRKVVRRHAGIETEFVSQPDGLQQSARRDLLMGRVPSNDRHRQHVPRCGVRSTCWTSRSVGDYAGGSLS